MMVLPMDVCCERPAHGDEPRAGGDRHEPALGDGCLQKGVDADSGAQCHDLTGRVHVL